MSGHSIKALVTKYHMANSKKRTLTPFFMARLFVMTKICRDAFACGRTQSPFETQKTSDLSCLYTSEPPYLLDLLHDGGIKYVNGLQSLFMSCRNPVPSVRRANTKLAFNFNDAFNRDYRKSPVLPNH
jgi:hypothetical protein